MTTHTFAQPCRFPALPAELRCHIYELAFGYDEPLIDYNSSGFLVPRMGCWPSGQEPTRATALLRTCRQIYTEALPVLYDMTTFVIRFNELSLTDSDAGPEVPQIAIYLRPDRITRIQVLSDFQLAASDPERLHTIRTFIYGISYCWQMRHCSLHFQRRADDPDDVTDACLTLFETMHCPDEVELRFYDDCWDLNPYKGRRLESLCQHLEAQSLKSTCELVKVNEWGEEESMSLEDIAGLMGSSTTSECSDLSGSSTSSG